MTDRIRDYFNVEFALIASRAKPNTPEYDAYMDLLESMWYSMTHAERQESKSLLNTMRQCKLTH